MKEAHKFHYFFTSGLNFLTSVPLLHHDDCRLLGIDPDLTIYVEEIYGDDDLLAQHAITPAGAIIQSVDEQESPNNFAPLALPANLQRPAPVNHAQKLSFSGPRQRGLREAERITDVVRPLEVPTKIKLIQQLKLDILPPQILGIAESRVLAEAHLSPDTCLVCRRLRIAYALTTPRYEADNQPYDYDTLELYTAHLYDVADNDIEVSPDIVLAGLPGVELSRPMDCIVFQRHLFVADGGSANRSSHVHVWQMRD